MTAVFAKCAGDEATTAVIARSASDEAIQTHAASAVARILRRPGLDCFAPLAMTAVFAKCAGDEATTAVIARSASDEATQNHAASAVSRVLRRPGLDCFAPLAMTAVFAKCAGDEATTTVIARSASDEATQNHAASAVSRILRRPGLDCFAPLAMTAVFTKCAGDEATTAVIARSASDEAIQNHAASAVSRVLRRPGLDCFAPLAMTVVSRRERS